MTIEICMMNGMTFRTRIDESVKSFVKFLSGKGIAVGDAYINPKYIAYIRPVAK